MLLEIKDDADVDVNDFMMMRTFHWQKVELLPEVRGLQLSCQQSPAFFIIINVIVVIIDIAIIMII